MWKTWTWSLQKKAEHDHFLLVEVYSTCSLHRIENEDVVEAALATSTAFQVVEALPWWRNAPRPEAELLLEIFGGTKGMETFENG